MPLRCAAADCEERLSLLPNGDVLYKLKRRWRDGSTHVQLTPHTLIERLCAALVNGAWLHSLERRVMRGAFLTANASIRPV